MKSVPLATTPITEQKTGKSLALPALVQKVMNQMKKTNIFVLQKLHLLQPASCQKSWPHHARIFTRVSLKTSLELIQKFTTSLNSGGLHLSLCPVSPRRTTCSNPRVPESGATLQVFWPGAANGGWDRIRGALHQTHLRQTHGVPVRLHKHSERPAAAEGQTPNPHSIWIHLYGLEPQESVIRNFLFYFVIVGGRTDGALRSLWGRTLPSRSQFALQPAGVLLHFDPLTWWRPHCW